MWNHGHDAYLESRVLTADPVELVDLLYQACTHAVREARAHLEGGRIAERSREITRAWEILNELASSLDFERGGEISQRLAPLYAYLQGRLLEANLQQSDEPLAEVLGLVATLAEGWAGIMRVETASPAAAGNAWAQPTPADSGYGVQGWNF